MITPFPRFFGTSVSLDYANRWRGSHTNSACHGDRKLCSTRRENSSPGRRYGCTNIADIVTPSGHEVLHARRSERPAGPQFGIGTSTQSAQGCIRRFPVRRPNSSPGAWSRVADAIAYRHPFSQLGITFRSVIEIAYMTPIRNRHSETVDRALVSQNSISGPKFRRGACVLVHRLPLGRTRIFARPANRSACEAVI
ncbi:hypothetical protein Taro_042681 [Colocasia esculenta]|uniref:Uncharacterized protein n=1 Tax=Colocasia esculenta TaxID=4460 RepID=A0A843WHH3_COLES|nr:hypothetical protein [Colocasia esculenta]